MRLDSQALVGAVNVTNAAAGVTRSLADNGLLARDGVAGVAVGGVGGAVRGSQKWNNYYWKKYNNCIQKYY